MYKERVFNEELLIEYEYIDYLSSIDKLYDFDQFNQKNKEYILSLKSIKVNGCPKEFVEVRKQLLDENEEAIRILEKFSNFLKDIKSKQGQYFRKGLDMGLGIEGPLWIIKEYKRYHVNVKEYFEIDQVLEKCLELNKQMLDIAEKYGVNVTQARQYTDIVEKCPNSKIQKRLLTLLIKGDSHPLWKEAMNISRKGEHDQAIKLLKKAFKEGFHNFELIKHPDFQRTANTSLGKYLLKPKLNIYLDKGQCNDDIIIYNNSLFTLTNITINVHFIDTSTTPQTWEDLKLYIPILDSGEQYKKENFTSNIKSTTNLLLLVTIQCNEHEEIEERYFFDQESSKKCWTLPDYFNDKAWEIYKKRDFDQISKAINLAEKAVELTCRQECDILDTLAWLKFLNGEHEEAKQIMYEIIRLIEYDGLVDDLMNYKRRLNKMENGILIEN